MKIGIPEDKMLASTFIFLLRDIVTHMTQMHQWYPLIEPHGGEKGSYAIVKRGKECKQRGEMNHGFYNLPRQNFRNQLFVL